MAQEEEEGLRGESQSALTHGEDILKYSKMHVGISMQIVSQPKVVVIV